MGSIYAIATMDTKGEEIGYVAECIRNAGAEVTVVDVGTQTDAQGGTPDVSRETIATYHAGGTDAVIGHTDRGEAVTAMGEALCAYLLQEYAEGNVAGIIGIGGSGGTALITPAMQAIAHWRTQSDGIHRRQWQLPSLMWGVVILP